MELVDEVSDFLFKNKNTLFQEEGKIINYDNFDVNNEEFQNMIHKLPLISYPLLS